MRALFLLSAGISHRIEPFGPEIAWCFDAVFICGWAFNIIFEAKKPDVAGCAENLWHAQDDLQPLFLP